MYYAAGLRNREHLNRYESGNVVMQLKDEGDAETTVCELADLWNNGKSFFIGCFDKVSQDFVAQVYVGPVNSELPDFQIGFFVDREYEGRGYVTEAVKATLKFAFHHLHAHKISAECDETNVRSIRVLERCGFVQEGLHRDNERSVDGTISSTMHYGMLRKEYRRLFPHHSE
jgi:aminoglycoside 6'-N-acetyltransferase